MKIVYIILGIIIVGILIYSFSTRRDIKNTQQAKIDIKNNPYLGLRNMALGATPDKLQLKLSKDKTEIYGVVMDWDLGDGTATLVSFITGDASIYLSSGGGFIGGGEHEKVNIASNNFIKKSEIYLDRASLTESTPLPDKNGLNFYFLTNNGIFKATEQMQNIESEKSQWFDLFEEANKLITEIRIASEVKTN